MQENHVFGDGRDADDVGLPHGTRPCGQRLVDG